MIYVNVAVTDDGVEVTAYNNQHTVVGRFMSLKAAKDACFENGWKIQRVYFI